VELINKLVSLNKGNQLNSTGAQVATAVNGLIDQRAPQAQTVILFGDSYSDAQQSQNALYIGEVLSISVWRFVFGRYGRNLKIVGNSSLAGSDSAELLSRLPSVLAVPSDWVFMNIGANDFYNASYTAETVFNNMTAATEPLLDDGRKVLLLASFPQLASRSGFSAPKSLESQKYNRMMAEWCAGRGGVFFVDTFQNSVDWSDTTNAAGLNKDFITDGIHVSITCGIEVMSACSKFLDLYVQRQLSLNFGPTIPTVIGISKSVLAGTAGTNGTGSSGSVATSFTASRSAGANGTIVASKLSPVGQRLTITLGATNGLSTFRFFTGANSALAAVIGQRIATSTKMRVRTTSGTAFLRQLSTRLFASDGVTNYNQYNGRVQGSFPTSSMVAFDTGEIILDTYPLLIPATVAGSSGYYFEIELDSTTGATVEVDIYGIDTFVVV
jgi:lysophospholipase L1-like esterase